MIETPDLALLERLREVLAEPATEAELRVLTERADALVRVAGAQLEAAERRLDELTGDPASSLADMAAELQRADAAAAFAVEGVTMTGVTDIPHGDEARLWLFGVARRTLANQHRRERRETELAAALAAALRTPGTATDAGGDLDEELAEALARLSAADRELVLLNAWDGLTPAEIAVVLRRPAGVIRVRLHRARKRLRTRLGEAEAEDESNRVRESRRHGSLVPGASR